MLFSRNFPQHGAQGKGMGFKLDRRYLSNQLNIGNDVSRLGPGNEVILDLLFRLAPLFCRITTF